MNDQDNLPVAEQELGPGIGIVGGTGPAGSALAARLADCGFSVTIGSRSKSRSTDIVDRILEKWPDRTLDIKAGDNAAAAQQPFIVIATPWDAAAITARGLGSDLDGKVVVTMSNALARVDGEFVPLIPPRGSVAASVQAVIPNAQVAATLHHVPAKELGDLNETLQSDVLICSDHIEATHAVAAVLERIEGVRAFDSGNLSNATAIEAFASVLLQLNTRYKTRVGLKFTGLDDR